MARQLYALTEQDRRELRDMRRRVNGAHGSRRPVPTRRRNVGGSGGGGSVTWGLVSVATGATWDNDCNALVVGELEAWPFLTASDLPNFDSGSSYTTGDLINLSAPAYDSATSYDVGDTATQAGSVYRCTTATTGTFDSGDWALMDTPGVKCANTSIAAGDYDGAEWDDVTADEFIDRDGATVTLPLRFTSEPPEGALVGWTSGQIVVLTCDAVDGWA